MDFTTFHCMYINTWLALWYSKSNGFNLFRTRAPRKFADWWTENAWWNKNINFKDRQGCYRSGAWRFSAGGVLVAICSAVLLLVSEMGRQQLLYIMINIKLLPAEYFIWVSCSWSSPPLSNTFFFIRCDINMICFILSIRYNIDMMLP